MIVEFLSVRTKSFALTSGFELAPEKDSRVEYPKTYRGQEMSCEIGATWLMASQWRTPSGSVGDW